MSTSNLHPGQFGRLLGELAGGGFSEHLPTASKPSSGFMVSDYGTEQKIPSAQTTEAHLSDFARGRNLTTSPPGEYLGGWRSPKGVDFLDVSRRYPTRAAGTAAMAFQNQESMYEASKPATADDAYTYNKGFVKDYDESAAMKRGEVIPTWLRPSQAERPQVRAVRKRS